MQNKKYSFCNCVIEIKHNGPIAEKNNYGIFATDNETVDFVVDVENVSYLPSKEGVRLFSEELHEVYFDGENRKTYSAFPVSRDESVDFACRVNNEKLYISFRDEINEFLVFEGLRLSELLLLKGIGILHCSFIEVNGEAILFAGDKQVGKSTQAALWEKYASATIINGDRAGLFIKDGKVTAGGVPYCGTSGICKNRQLPVKAIVCLSKGTENKIEKLSPLSAFMFLMGKFAYNTWDVSDVNSITGLLTEIVEKIPVYSYSCLKDESAVKYLSERI